MQNKLELSAITNTEMNLRCDKLEKDVMDMVKIFFKNNFKNSKNNILFLSNESNKQKSKVQQFSKREFLDKKFSSFKYEDKYIINCLQKDILDFQEYTKEQIKKNKQVVDDLLKFVQTAVNDSIPDYEVLKIN